jgi:prepilin-type processing-associated H-X9-DG protein
MKTDPAQRGPRFSKLAILSPLLSILGVCILVLILYWEGAYSLLGLSLIPFYLTPFYVYGHLASGLMIAAGVIGGITAVKRVRSKARILKGERLAVSGAVIGAVFLVCWVLHCPGSTFAAQTKCAANLKMLGKWMLLYAGDYDEQYPTTEKWCDLLAEYMDTSVDSRAIERCFKCPANKKGRCHYAMNPNPSTRLHHGLVLLFEAKGGWNQFGGPELLTLENHGGTGCNILFNDGHVEFVEAERINQLKWQTAKNEPNGE